MREPAQDFVLYCEKCHFIGMYFHGIGGFEGCDCPDDVYAGGSVRPIHIPLSFLELHPKWNNRRGGFVIDDNEFKQIIFGAAEYVQEHMDMIEKTVREALSQLGLMGGQSSLYTFSQIVQRTRDEQKIQEWKSRNGKRAETSRRGVIYCKKCGFLQLDLVGVPECDCILKDRKAKRDNIFSMDTSEWNPENYLYLDLPWDTLEDSKKFSHLRSGFFPSKEELTEFLL